MTVRELSALVIQRTGLCITKLVFTVTAMAALRRTSSALSSPQVLKNTPLAFESTICLLLVEGVPRVIGFEIVGTVRKNSSVLSALVRWDGSGVRSPGIKRTPPGLLSPSLRLAVGEQLRLRRADLRGTKDAKRTFSSSSSSTCADAS